MKANDKNHMLQNLIFRDQKTLANSDDSQRENWWATQNRNGLPCGKLASGGVQKRVHKLLGK